MRDTRIFVEQSLICGQSIRLPAGTSRHLAGVLRLRAGQRVHAFDGSGGYYISEITSAQRSGVELKPIEFVEADRESPLALTLVQGISRGAHMDYALQKAVELGVSGVVPVRTRFSTVRLDAAKVESRLQHWRRIAVNACEQCGRYRLPQIREPMELDAWLAESFSGLKLVLDPTANGTLGGVQHDGGRIAVLCGPEGGLDAPEIEQAAAAGYRRTRFGPRILRTETAAVAALTACQLRWGDLG